MPLAVDGFSFFLFNPRGFLNMQLCNVKRRWNFHQTDFLLSPFWLRITEKGAGGDIGVLFNCYFSVKCSGSNRHLVPEGNALFKIIVGLMSDGGETFHRKNGVFKCAIVIANLWMEWAHYTIQCYSESPSIARSCCLRYSLQMSRILFR